MQELDYNPSKKDLTDAKIHHLLTNELTTNRRVSFKTILFFLNFENSIIFIPLAVQLPKQDFSFSSHLFCKILKTVFVCLFFRISPYFTTTFTRIAPIIIPINTILLENAFSPHKKQNTQNTEQNYKPTQHLSIHKTNPLIK